MKKYIAKVTGIFPETFSNLKSARAWVRERYGVGEYGSGYEIRRVPANPSEYDNLVESGAVYRGRLYPRHD